MQRRLGERTEPDRADGDAELGASRASSPRCSSASQARSGRARCPAAASGSRVERRAAMAANSAPTKKALPSSRSTEIHRRQGMAHCGRLPVAARPSAPSAAARSGSGTNRSRSTRRPSMPSDADRPAGHRHARRRRRGPGRGSAMTNPPIGLVGRPVRDHGAERVAHLVGPPQARAASTTRRPSASSRLRRGRARRRPRRRSPRRRPRGSRCRRSRRTRRRRPPSGGRRRAASEQQRVEADRLGHHDRRHHQRADRARPADGRAARRWPS